MNWDAISAISEMVAAVGVIVTLGYLAVQIRQNTRQLKQNERTAIASAVSESAATWRENRRHIYTNAEVAELYLKGAADLDSLDELQKYRFRLLIQNTMDAVWDLYSQTVVTGFSPETWSSQGVSLVRRVFTTPGGRWFWLQFRDEYTEEFRREIERILGSNQGAEQRNNKHDSIEDAV